MNIIHISGLQRRRYLTSIATTVILAGAGLLTAPPASALRCTCAGSFAAPAVSADIADVVTARKVAMAQDRVDRARLYR